MNAFLSCTVLRKLCTRTFCSFQCLKILALFMIIKVRHVCDFESFYCLDENVNNLWRRKYQFHLWKYCKYKVAYKRIKTDAYPSISCITVSDLDHIVLTRNLALMSIYLLIVVWTCWNFFWQTGASILRVVDNKRKFSSVTL